MLIPHFDDWIEGSFRILLDHSKIALVAMICNPSGLDKQVEWENHRYNKLTTTNIPGILLKVPRNWSAPEPEQR